MDVRVGPERRLRVEALMLLDCGGSREKTLFKNPLDNKEIKPVNPKRYQPRTFIRKTDA